MTCEQCQPLLIDALLGDLPSEQKEIVDAHLSACVACQSESDRLQADFSFMAESVEPVKPPHGLRARLMTSLSDSSGQDAAVESRESEVTSATIAFRISEAIDQPTTVQAVGNRTSSWSRGFLWAATLAGITVGGLLTAVMQNRSGQNQTQQAAAKRQQAAQELAGVMRSAQRLAGETGLRKATFQSKQRPDLSAMLIWDVPSRQLHLHAVGLPQPPDGQEYRLWLIDAQEQWTLAGALSDRTSGAANTYQMLAAAPEGIDPIAAVVTVSKVVTSDSTEDRGQEIARTQFAAD